MRSHDWSPTQLLPVALLLTGIAIHGVRIIAFDEDPQRGSAFAMFASVDLGSTREVRVSAPGDSPVNLEIPHSLDEQRKRLADVPTDDSARRFARLVLDLTWEVDGHTAMVGGDMTFDQVRVEVVGFDAEGRTLTTRVLTDVVVRGAGP
jgi:hypothetical protein